MRQTLLILAALAAAAPALADDHPLLRPARDVAVEYRTSGMPPGAAAEPGKAVTMRFASKTGRIRIDGPNGRGYAIVDVDAARMTVIMAERSLYMERPADPGMLAMFQATNAAFRKTGTDTIAGVGCTTYDATINDHNGQVCLTGDGVLLRARSDDADRHREFEALKVTYGDQPAALFEVPAGFQKMDIPDAGRRPISGFGPPDVRGSYMGTPTGR
jgi:hypothetical protein